MASFEHDELGRARLRAIAEGSPEGDPSALAETFVASLAADELRALAVAYATDEIKHFQRILAQLIEIEAERAAYRAQHEAELRRRDEEMANRRAEIEEQRKSEAARTRDLARTRPARRQAESDARRAALLARMHRELVDPEIPERAPGIAEDLFDRVVEVEMTSWDDGRFFEHERQTTRRLTAQETEIGYTAIFRLWLGARFDDWYMRAVERIAAGGNPSDVALFRRRWEPEFIAPAYLDDDLALCWQRLKESVAHCADEVRLEITTELLLTTFALGDGRRVTWGDATIEQHEQRVAVLLRGAQGTIETAGRHTEAIRMIRDGGVTCLRDLAEQAA